MNLHAFNLDLLPAFVAVSETRHFTRAAERLNCVQSAVSMQIQRLEESLEVRLFERNNRQVRLTAEGEILLEYAQRILRLKEQAVAEIETQNMFGAVRVAASDWSMSYLPDVLKRFGKKYPKVEVELQCVRSWEALDDLDAGKIDLAFVTQKCGRKGGLPVSRSQLVWAAQSSSDIDERNPVPLALFGPGCIYRKAATDALTACGKAFRYAYESPGRAGLECAVMAGLAVTVVPQDDMMDGLRVLPVSKDGFPPLPFFNTYLFRASSKQSASVRAFADLLIDSIATR
jgi:DNA-binding transcriptional LysR family regulator